MYVDIFVFDVITNGLIYIWNVRLRILCKKILIKILTPSRWENIDFID